MEEKKPVVGDFTRYAQAIESEILIAKQKVQAGSNTAMVETQQHIQRGSEEIICMTDGSWTDDWLGGIGCVIFKGDILLAHKSVGVRTCFAFQTEALAMKEAIQLVQNMNLIDCTFITDNQQLVQLCNSSNPPLNSDWRAYYEVFDVWRMFKRSDFSCSKAPRSQISLADFLAKRGRLEQWDQVGFTFPLYEELR